MTIYLNANTSTELNNSRRENKVNRDRRYRLCSVHEGAHSARWFGSRGRLGLSFS